MWVFFFRDNSKSCVSWGVCVCGIDRSLKQCGDITAMPTLPPEFRSSAVLKCSGDYATFHSIISAFQGLDMSLAYDKSWIKLALA